MNLLSMSSVREASGPSDTEDPALLPILSEGTVAHVFSPSELSQCAQGVCCRCSRCCYLLQIEAVPLNVGVARKPADISWSTKWFATKARNALCPQHSWNEQGLSTCACHHDKKAPIMASCAEFEPSEDVYENMKDMTRGKLIRPTSGEDIALMQDWNKRGLLSDISPLSDAEIGTFVMNVLGVTENIPADLFDYAGVRGFFERMETDRHMAFLDQCQQKCSETRVMALQQYLMAA